MDLNMTICAFGEQCINKATLEACRTAFIENQAIGMSLGFVFLIGLLCGYAAVKLRKK